MQLFIGVPWEGPSNRKTKFTAFTSAVHTKILLYSTLFVENDSKKARKNNNNRQTDGQASN